MPAIIGHLLIVVAALVAGGIDPIDVAVAISGTDFGGDQTDVGDAEAAGQVDDLDHRKIICVGVALHH